VPISALVFGGRRREVAPLVYEARDWKHGVLVGASLASETTPPPSVSGCHEARPDGMQPFCGYNFGDYWQHWLNIGAKLARPRASTTSTGSGATRTASSCGRLRRELRCSPGCWIAAPARRARANPRRLAAAARDLDTGDSTWCGCARRLLTVDAGCGARSRRAARVSGRFGSRLPQALLAELASTEQRLG